MLLSCLRWIGLSLSRRRFRRTRWRRLRGRRRGLRSSRCGRICFPGIDLRAAIRACPLPVLVTLRSSAEGGRGPTDPGERRAVLEAAREAGAALIDLEHERDVHLMRALGLAPEQVVLSWHSTDGTPADLGEIAEGMLENAGALGQGGADSDLGRRSGCGSRAARAVQRSRAAAAAFADLCDGRARSGQPLSGAAARTAVVVRGVERGRGGGAGTAHDRADRRRDLTPQRSSATVVRDRRIGCQPQPEPDPSRRRLSRARPPLSDGPRQRARRRRTRRALRATGRHLFRPHRSQSPRLGGDDALQGSGRGGRRSRGAAGAARGCGQHSGPRRRQGGGREHRRRRDRGFARHPRLRTDGPPRGGSGDRRRGAGGGGGASPGGG